MTVLVLILIALIVMLGELFIFIGFMQCMDGKMSDTAGIPQPSEEGAFWQNIISYDHRKGGEKD